jgi:hypothetical protein
VSPWRRGDWWFDPGDTNHDGTGMRHRLVLVWRRYGGYLIVAVVLGIGLAFGLHFNNEANRRETESLQRDRVENLRALHAECLSQRNAIETNRLLLRDLIDDPVRPLPVPPGADEALRIAIEEANARSEANRAATLSRIDAQPVPSCDESERVLERARRRVDGDP